MKKGLWKRRAFAFLVAAAKWYMQQKQKEMKRQKMRLQKKYWTIVNKKDTIFKYIFWERLDSLPIPECCFHFVWCQIA